MPTPDEASLREELKSLFLATSNAVAQRLGEQNIPFTITYSQQVVKRDPTNFGAWRGEQCEAESNILSGSPVALIKIAPLTTPEVAASISTCAAHLAEFGAASLPFYSPSAVAVGWQLIRGISDYDLRMVDYSAEPVEWVERYILLPALYNHLENLPSVGVASDTAARAFAQAVLDFTASSNLNYSLTIPLAGLNLAKSRGSTLQDGEVTIRRLSESEQGVLLGHWGFGNFPRFSFADLPLVALEILVPTPRGAQTPDVRELVARWISAFQLHGYSVAGMIAQIQASPEWAASSTSFSPLSAPSQARKWTTVSPVALQRIKTTVKRLGNYNVSAPQSAHDFAIHRLSSGAARQNNADAVVDFVIALESLLLPDQRNELRYRFGLHGAHYLTKRKSERIKLSRRLTELYDLRSRLVHGGVFPPPAEIEAGRKDAEDLARRGLLTAVTEGFPTADKLKQMVLGL